VEEILASVAVSELFRVLRAKQLAAGSAVATAWVNRAVRLYF
jgi:hypothetical protein